MKKKLITLIALIMSIVATFSVLSGCNLITKDSERDMAQKVAVVKIDDAITDERLTTITKKDLMLAYINNGSALSEQNMTQAQAVNYIFNSLVDSKVVVQYAMSAFDKGEAPFDSVYLNPEITDKWDIKRYLTEEDLVDAEYSAKSIMASLIESYDEQEDEKQDTALETVRTAPSNASHTHELTKEEKQKFNTDFDKEDRFNRDSYLSAIKALDSNSLKGNKYDGTITSTDYYQSLLFSSYEDVILERYSVEFVGSSLAKVDFDQLSQAYLDKIDEQKAWSNTEFVNAFSNASVGSPVLYSAFGTYGYVYNLLLGVDSKQSTSISEIKTDNPNISNEDYAVKRAEVLAETKIKDLRSTWITAGYDFDGTYFTGDYSFAKDTANALAFKGTTTHLNPDEANEDDYHAKYRVDSVEEFTLDAFITLMNTHLNATSTNEIEYTGLNKKSVLNEKIYELSGVSEYDEKINDLLFAFSTDSGSLNTFKGYAIKPAVDGNDSEQYVETFAEAGRILIQNAKDGYVIVASDYGYHVMFFSEVLTPNVAGYATLTEYLIANEGDKNWQEEYAQMISNWAEYENTTSYLYLLTSELSASRVNDELSKEKTKIVNQYRYGENKGAVKEYRNAFANLLGE